MQTRGSVDLSAVSHWTVVFCKGLCLDPMLTGPDAIGRRVPPEMDLALDCVRLSSVRISSDTRQLWRFLFVPSRLIL